MVQVLVLEEPEVPEDPQDSAEVADSVAVVDLVEAEVDEAAPTSRAFR